MGTSSSSQRGFGNGPSVRPSHEALGVLINTRERGQIKKNPSKSHDYYPWAGAGSKKCHISSTKKGPHSKSRTTKHKRREKKKEALRNMTISLFFQYINSVPSNHPSQKKVGGEWVSYHLRGFPSSACLSIHSQNTNQTNQSQNKTPGFSIVPP